MSTVTSFEPRRSPNAESVKSQSKSARMAPKVAEKAVKAPATKAPAAKKVVKKATAGASKKKVKAVESYKIYIYKVLKQVRPTATLPSMPEDSHALAAT